MPDFKYDYREVAKLYYKGLSHKEIESELKMPRGMANKIINKIGVKRRIKDNTKQGERHNRAKLTEKQVRRIISLRNGGETFKEIALKYDVHWVTIRDIYTGKSWAYLQYLISQNKKIKSNLMTYQKLISNWNLNRVTLASKMGMAVTTFKNKLNENQTAYKFTESEERKLISILLVLAEEITIVSAQSTGC